MRKNKIKQMWENDEAVVNGWIHLGSPYGAELMAHAGFDSLTVDMQHGPQDFGTAVQLLQAISTTDVVPTVRVPWNEPSLPQRLLDAGAYGLICPMVNTREECEQFVAACRYYPDGFRSSGVNRGRLYGGADYMAQANKEIMVMVMIETAQAIENCEDIVSVPGLDGVYVGPSDLSLTMFGLERMSGDNEEPEFHEAMDKLLAACKANGVYAGIHCGQPAYAKRMIDKGFRFVTLQGDSGFLRSKAAEVVSEMRAEMSKESVDASEKPRTLY